MFNWFENKLDPFPAAEPVEPPKTLIAFCVHYTRGAWPYILVDAVQTHPTQTTPRCCGEKAGGAAATGRAPKP